MDKYLNLNFEDANPNPEYLIKSIAEQGYSLETALADLMDNSISANADKVEVLIKTDEEPFTLFLADNGDGMDEDTLKASMQFPSNSPEHKREGYDLGRFGLGMKTASFSQTRCFTVLSKKKGELQYCGRTWDVDYLKSKKEWRLIVNSEDEVNHLLQTYRQLSDSYLNKFDAFEPSTIIIWKGLYKFENYLEAENRQNALKREITEITSDYLSLVFHKFMEREKNAVNIKINNKILSPFNPFPTMEKDFRPIAYKQRHFSTDTIKMEGFVLPSRSIDESRKGLTNWTTKNRSLMDMEGIYIYRADRIILFGGWNGLIKKAPRLQLARLRVEIGNSVDHLLHLNVAKSQVVIPHDLKKAFERYIEELKIEAEKEFFNRGIKNFANNKQQNKETLFERKASNKGVLLELNNEFPLLKEIKQGLTGEQSAKFNLVLRMINTSVNKIRHVHEDISFVNIEEKDGLSLNDILISLTTLINSGFTSEQIKKDILPGLGFEESSLPEEIKKILK
jgi:hypothetical protein